MASIQYHMKDCVLMEYLDANRRCYRKADLSIGSSIRVSSMECVYDSSYSHCLKTK